MKTVTRYFVIFKNHYVAGLQEGFESRGINILVSEAPQLKLSMMEVDLSSMDALIKNELEPLAEEADEVLLVLKTSVELLRSAEEETTEQTAESHQCVWETLNGSEALKRIADCDPKQVSVEDLKKVLDPESQMLVTSLFN